MVTSQKTALEPAGVNSYDSSACCKRVVFKVCFRFQECQKLENISSCFANRIQFTALISMESISKIKIQIIKHSTVKTPNSSFNKSQFQLQIHLQNIFCQPANSKSFFSHHFHRFNPRYKPLVIGHGHLSIGWPSPTNGEHTTCEYPFADGYISFKKSFHWNKQLLLS